MGDQISGAEWSVTVQMMIGVSLEESLEYLQLDLVRHPELPFW